MKYDVMIVGGGPAGISASIYAVRRHIKTLIVEKLQTGGQMLLTADIENYPGVGLISGVDLSARMEEHCKKLGVEFTSDEILRIEKDKGGFNIQGRSNSYESKAVIVATGGSHKHLDVKGEEDFQGKGISYCATCDAPFFSGKSVAVVGGGNSAVTDALYLADIAKEVHLIHRKDVLRAEEAKIAELDKIGVKIHLNSSVEEIGGEQTVGYVTVKDIAGDTISKLDVDGVFISIGNIPVSEFAKDMGVKLDANGYIVVDRVMQTNVLGVFAAGDVTGGVLQIATAIGEGCAAGLSAYDYIKKPYWSK